MLIRQACADKYGRMEQPEGYGSQQYAEGLQQAAREDASLHL
jgi:hypothetical protein